MITSYTLIAVDRAASIQIRSQLSIEGWSARLRVIEADGTSSIVDGVLDLTRGGVFGNASFTLPRSSGGKRFELSLVDRGGTAFVVLSGTISEQAEDNIADYPVDVFPGPSRELVAQYIHTQEFAATVWNINHGLERWPSVTVVDSAGSEVEGEVVYVDTNNIRLYFSAAFSGRAFIGG